LGLYKGVVWEKNPKLFYLGMQDQYYTFNMFDAQAWYVRDVILNYITLPSQDEMIEDSLVWHERELQLKDEYSGIHFQGDYIKDLMAFTDYPWFDIDAVNDTFIEWKHHKHEDIMNFRDNTYRSVLTGTMQPKHHTVWVEAMDDSLESYLQLKPEIIETVLA
jgi:trimethylamine monooxygenase